MSEREPFDTGAAAAAAARKLYPNQGLHHVAEVFAFCHPRAIQYLQAAPVIVMGAGWTRWEERKRGAALVHARMIPLCARGAPLKDVMRAFGMAPPLRKLKGFALVPACRPTLEFLGRIDPIVLGRIIPVKPGAQRKWLSAMGMWLDHGYRRSGGPTADLFAWAAEATAKAGVDKHDVGHVADFATYPGSGFSMAWGWPRAAEEAAAWHSRITLEQALRGTPFSPDSILDLGLHADQATVAGFEFTALRTPLSLHQEGTAMRHCVATYLNQVAAGRSRIVSMRRAGARVCTVELDADWVVRQIRRKANAQPHGEELTAAARYAFQTRAAVTEAMIAKRMAGGR